MTWRKNVDPRNLKFEELEAEFGALLWREVRRWHLGPMYDLDDALQEARLVLFRAARAWRPGRSQFQTYLYSALRNHFANLGIRVYRTASRPAPGVVVPLEGAVGMAGDRSALSDVETLAGLSPPARELARRICANSPVSEWASDPALAELRAYLLTAHG